MSSNLTNPEQVDCPRCEGDGLVSVDTVLPYGDTTIDECPDCGGTGKIAANVNTTDAQAKLNVNEAAKTRQDDANGPIPASTLPRHDDTPAPVDQPHELEQQTAKLHELEAKVDTTELEQRLYDQILQEVRVFHCAEHGPVCATLAVSIATKISGLWAQSLTREREASYAEGWRHGKFLEKNRHILHLRYMLDGYPSDAPEYTYVKSLFEREIAALTKGETT